MKFTRKITITQTIEAYALKISVHVNYEEDYMPYDAPLRNGEIWEATILLDEGRIENWPKGETLSFYMKVRDRGTYIVLDKNAKQVLRRDGYVPNRLLPGEYGDYLELNIDENGNITNWLSYANLSDFIEDDED